ncbi:hypothetical protein KAZ93_01650 [Patescibacteria group bacterium]|nr:hypothetical protein [Patescibacteria group bacterium]
MELFGKSPTRKVRLSYNLLNDIGQPERYILDKGIDRSRKQQLILQFIEKKLSITTKQLYALFPSDNKSSLRGILYNMLSLGMISMAGK